MRRGCLEAGGILAILPKRSIALLPFFQRLCKAYNFLLAIDVDSIPQATIAVI